MNPCRHESVPTEKTWAVSPMLSRCTRWKVEPARTYSRLLPRLKKKNKLLCERPLSFFSQSMTSCFSDDISKLPPTVYTEVYTSSV